MSTNPENEFSTERELSTDELLVAAIGRADSVIERLIEFDIGTEAYVSYHQERAIEDELSTGLSPDAKSNLDIMKNREIKKRANRQGVQYLINGLGFRQALDRGQQDAQLAVVEETLSEVSTVYYGSFNSAFGLVSGLLNQKIANGFQLESLNRRMTLSRAVDQNTQINVAYEIDEGIVCKSAFYLSSSSFATKGVPGSPSLRVEINIDRHNMAGGVDIETLEKESLAALEQVTDELAVYLK